MLEKKSIVPDYVTNLDFTDLAMKFFQNKENLKQSIIALECATHPNIVRSLKAENCMIVLRNKALYQRFNLNDFGYIDTGTHVSHFSYTLALALGFKNIIMIGQDLAFDKEGNSHSKGFDFGEKFSGEELCSGKIYLVDIEEERVDIQLLILFDMKDISEYLSLYEMFVNNVYYKKFYEDIWHKADELCEKNIKVVIRNLGSNSDLSFECYSHLLQNIPSMLESIPFQRILSERKNKFENAIVVSAGPSLAKQLPFLKLSR